jgi:tight adherence protein B
MDLHLILFVGITSIAIFSILMLIYWKRQVILDLLSGRFNQAVASNQSGSGGFRDAATFTVVFKLLSWTVIPVTVWFLTNSILFSLIGIFLGYKIPIMIAEWRRKRRLASMERDLPVALAMFASALSGGVSLSVAIQTYTAESRTPLSSEFSYLLRLQRLGVEFDSALEQVAARVNLLDFELVTLAMRISKAVGGNLSETLLTLSQSIQQKLIIEGKIQALTSQGVMQAWVMSLLPAMVAGVLTLIQPDQMDKLFNTFSGNVVLGICVVMDYIGFKVIKKILTIDV